MNILVCVVVAAFKELSWNWPGCIYEHYETSGCWRQKTVYFPNRSFNFISILICSAMWNFKANSLTDTHNRFHDTYTKIHGVRFSHWSNIMIVTSGIWEAACVGTSISMGGICEVRRWNGRRLRVIPNNFRDDRLRRSNNINVITSTARRLQCW
jgi:hypothetical protein